MDRAAREYTENHRDEIYGKVRAALGQLDGSLASAVSLLTGFSAEELAELGGFGHEPAGPVPGVTGREIAKPG